METILLTQNMKTMKTNLKKIGGLSLILWIAFSCRNNDNVVNNEFVINIDKTEYRSVNEAVGGNENCDNLYINASYNDKSTIDFTIKFEISKNGELMRAWYEEYTLPLKSGQGKKIFLTPNFNPILTFTISNFYYDFNTGEVRFNFSGTLYFENNNSVSKNVAGEIKIKSLKSVECSIAKRGLSYNDNNFRLFSYSNKAVKYSDQTQVHRFFSNNGYRLYFYFENDPWNYPLGEITFDESKLLDKVEFKKAIGPITADQLQLIDKQVWENYENSGTIYIKEKYVEKNRKVIRGSLNIVAKKDGIVKYNLKGIEFRTSSFEN